MNSRYQITAATSVYFNEILSLFSSQEELFLIYPSAVWPFDLSQLIDLSDKRFELTVMLESEIVIGFANLYRSLSEDKVFIGNVVVSKAHRGKGAGRQLVRHMCGRVFEKYASEAHLTVFNQNTPALILYSTLGFRPYDLELRQMPNSELTLAIHMKLGRRDWR